MLLKVESLVVDYGSHRALRGLSFEVASGEVIAILGPNGAGKTTTANAVCGHAHVTSGSVSFDGMDITNKSDWEIARRGIAQVPEGRRVFGRLSVRENLLVGAHVTPRAEIDGLIDRVVTLFPALKTKMKQKAGQLSGGQQQMVAIARAMMSRPRLLILDEPTMGLAPIVIEQIGTTLVELSRTEGLSMVLIDQRFGLVERAASRAYALRNGEAGAPHQVSELSAPMLAELYLGQRTPIAGSPQGKRPLTTNSG